MVGPTANQPTDYEGYISKNHSAICFSTAITVTMLLGCNSISSVNKIFGGAICKIPKEKVHKLFGQAIKQRRLLENTGQTEILSSSSYRDFVVQHQRAIFADVLFSTVFILCLVAVVRVGNGNANGNYIV